LRGKDGESGVELERDINEAAQWAVRATGRPNAHPTSWRSQRNAALANRPDEARKILARIHPRSRGYGFADFRSAFRVDRDTEQLFGSGAQQIGFDSSSATKPRH